MSVHGADFSTQQYRHGVLVGNWHEDQGGCDLLATAAARSAATAAAATRPLPYPVLLSVPQSVTHTSYTQAGHETVRRAVWEEQAQARHSSEVPHHILFGHKGASSADKNISTYAETYTAGQGAQPASVERTVENMLAPTGGGMEEDGRLRSYRTAHSDAFNASTSVLALKADESAAAMRRPRQITQSLEATYRKLRLRQ